MRASYILGALEDAWDVIRSYHPQIPFQFISIVRTDEQHGGWSDEMGVTLTTHIFDVNPEWVMGALLHEAAHVLGRVRGIVDGKDPDDLGEPTYHNKRFKMLATEVGLRHYSMKDKVNGWHTNMLSDEAKERYAPQIAAIEQAITLARLERPSSPTGRMPSA